MSPFLIYVVGCPGAGKGTLCKLLAAEYDCHHISVGDLLRELVDGPEQRYPDLKVHLKNGTLVPTATILSILKEHVDKVPDTCRAVIVDGFPREVEQGKAAEKHLGKPHFVFSFKCEESEAEIRYLSRGRGNDNKELFKRRYQEFEDQYSALEKYFLEMGVLVRLDTNGKTDENYRLLSIVFKARLNRLHGS
ncbi:Adenylate kinase isoenzyme [Lachnellula suecica]|uniref:Adenylate kinase isoenzyme n=1 Tax=Lachnellula suecica TaxID=602035 RepID=A0A8T9CNS5_9HELO|nr:Adenylate kinase isoenzyme [Lachnellula suecica]